MFMYIYIYEYITDLTGTMLSFAIVKGQVCKRFNLSSSAR